MVKAKTPTAKRRIAIAKGRSTLSTALTPRAKL